MPQQAERAGGGVDVQSRAAKLIATSRAAISLGGRITLEEYGIGDASGLYNMCKWSHRGSTACHMKAGAEEGTRTVEFLAILLVSAKYRYLLNTTKLCRIQQI